MNRKYCFVVSPVELSIFRYTRFSFLAIDTGAGGVEGLMNVSVNIRRVPEGSGLDLMAPVIEKSKGATGVGGRVLRGTINTRVVLINLISGVSNNDLLVPVSRTGSRTVNTMQTNAVCFKFE